MLIPCAGGLGFEADSFVRLLLSCSSLEQISLFVLRSSSETNDRAWADALQRLRPCPSRYELSDLPRFEISRTSMLTSCVAKLYITVRHGKVPEDVTGTVLAAALRCCREFACLGLFEAQLGLVYHRSSSSMSCHALLSLVWCCDWARRSSKDATGLMFGQHTAS